QKIGDRHQPTTQQSSHRNHGHNNDRHGSDRRGGGDNHRNSNNYSGNNNRRVVIGISRPLNRVVTGTMVIITTVMDQTGEVVVTITAAATTTILATITGILSRGPSEGYSYPVCTTCGRRHPGECRRASGTCFKCGQAGHLQKDCKKNTTASTSGQADKKPVHRVVFSLSLRIMLLRPQ
nr:hypothetical protein [Tanacetum cinerariifolium]GFB00536.1 hypothetical protein [Tanacetum cinerariifolium]